MSKIAHDVKRNLHGNSVLCLPNLRKVQAGKQQRQQITIPTRKPGPCPSTTYIVFQSHMLFSLSLSLPSFIITSPEAPIFFLLSILSPRRGANGGKPEFLGRLSCSKRREKKINKWKIRQKKERRDVRIFHVRLRSSPHRHPPELL